MSAEGESVTEWLQLAKQGDERAVARLYERYFRRLTGLARQRLGASRALAAADEEDVAQSAFHDFCRAARGGRYGGLDDRDGLWRVLVAFVRNKAAAYQDREQAAKRGGGLRRVGPDESSEGDPLGRVPAREADPALEAEVADQFTGVLQRLPEREAEVLYLRLCGHSAEEIAAVMGFSRATAGRLLRTAQDALANELGVEMEKG